MREIEDHDSEYIEKEKKDLKSQIEDMVQSIKTINTNLAKAKDIKAKIQFSIQNNNTKISEAKLQLQNKNNILQRINQLDEWQGELKGDLEAIESTETDFDTIIIDTHQRVNKLEAKVKTYRNKISKLDIVKYVVSEEGVKSYIVNKLLELLNSNLFV